jgi:hypothetical protein
VQTDSLSNDMAALLRILEEVERPVGAKRSILTHRQPAELREKAHSELEHPVSTVDVSENRFAERIATAMMRLRAVGTPNARIRN